MRAVRVRGPGEPAEAVEALSLPEEGGTLWVRAEGPVEDPDLAAALDIPARFRRYLTERPRSSTHAFAPEAVATTLFAIDPSFPPLRATPLTILLGARWVLVITWGPLEALESAWDERERLVGEGTDMILSTLLGPILDGYSQVVASLVHRAEIIDELVLKGAPKLYEDIHRVRQEALSVRKLVQPELDAMAVLKDHPGEPRTQPGEPYMEDLLLRLHRIAREVDGVRDGMMAVVESYASVVANRMNRVMKLLTVVSIVFLPATLIASIYGMNFHIPEYSWPHGYWYSLGLMVVISAGILLYMHAKGWFA